jgi:PAS domain S-box-containing protein
MVSQTGSTQKINIVILLVIAFILLVSVMAWFALDRVQEKIQTDIGNALQTVLQTTQESLNLWADNRKYHLSKTADDPWLLSLVERQLSVPRSQIALIRSGVLGELRNYFKQNKDRFGNTGFFIITPDFDNIASMRDDNIGITNLIALQRRDLLNRAFQGEIVMVPPVLSDVAEKKATMFFAAPIRNNLGKIIAVLAQRIDPSEDFTRLIQLGRIGKSGETYALGKYGLLLSDSRFDEELKKIGLIDKDEKGILAISIRDPGVNMVKGQRPTLPRYQQPLTLMADQAARGESGLNVYGYRDYRGVTVYGAWLWDDSLGIGLTTEIDRAEALSPYYTTRRVILTVLAITVLMALGSMLFAVLIDERANRALQKSHDELELRVEERTAELKENQERLERSEERSRLLLESAADGIFGVGENGLVNFINPAALEMLGFTEQEVIGQEVHPLVHHTRPDGTPYPIEECPMYHSLARGTIGNQDDEILWRKDGTFFHTEYTSVPIRKDDAIIGTVVIFRDITERKHMEAELVKSKQAADDANKAKGDFLANMSHEIRTPMNAVIGMAHLALKTELTAKQRDYLNKIQSSANALLGIINDILDFSKIEAGKLDIETVEFNLEEVLDNLANLVTVKAREKEELEVLFATDQDVPRFLVGDPLRLGQVLINLANNAVKFTESGMIVVSTAVEMKNEDRVILKFMVRDTGIGLTEAQMGKLFQSFSQADTSTTRKFGGTGLGLAISRKLVNMMGGEIWVESEYGRGTTFSFTADFGLGREKLKKRFVPATDLRGMNVLVVDDNAKSRQILKGMLESFSFKVTLAASGEEGLEEIEKADRENPFDLVVMDWKMPGIDGLEASERIKYHLELSKIPAIILVTAYGREEVIQKADKVGLDGFLLKPVNSSVLFDAAMQAFGKEVAEPSRHAQRRGKDIQGRKTIQGARILLVEDNEINQQVAKEILEGAGLVVSLAENGKEAVEAVKKAGYDAVLMDVQMPVMDGYTAAREIRNLKSEIRNVPVIAMTAHAMAGDEEKSIQAGMNGHITKPIDPDQLFDTLRKWIEPGAGNKASPQETAIESKDAERPTPQQDLLPEGLPGFDLEEGLQRLMGNKALYRKLLLDFGNKYGKMSEKIRKVLDAGDLQQAHGLVHNIKGLAGNLAATDLQAAAVEMEKLAKGATPESDANRKLNQKFAIFDHALKNALAAVQTLGSPIEETPVEASTDTAGGIPPELAEQAAERIKAAAEMGDVTELASIAEELKKSSASYLPLSKRIVQLAENFDFDGILELAAALERQV